MKPQLVGKGFDAHPENINKKGRPKALPDLNELLIAALTKEDLAEILKSLKILAKKGGIRETELLLNRAYGPVKQDIQVSGISLHFDKDDSNL